MAKPQSKNVPAVSSGKHLPAEAALYASASGIGLENAGREDFAIPFLTILQKLSPQLDKKDPAYIKEAESGMILNTATGELFPADEGVLVIPCFYNSKFVAWVAREKGGGYKGEYNRDDPVVRTTRRDDRGREFLPNSDIHLVDTRIFGVLVFSDGVPSPAILTMSSTQLKKAKKWCTGMQAKQAEEKRQGLAPNGYPIFAHAYRLTTIGESNDKGNWDGWVIEHEGLLHEAIKGGLGTQAFEAAMSFHQSLQSGEAKLRSDNPNADGGDRF
jgi:hypothetical protein